MNDDEQSLRAAEEVNDAMISNDVARIRTCITYDWMLVTPERGPISAEGCSPRSPAVFLATTPWQNRSGDPVGEDMAYVTGRGRIPAGFVPPR